MKKKIMLGFTKRELYGTETPIFLENFKWDCGWYWAGGYLGNCDCHFHFDGAFLEVPDRRGHPLGNIYTPWDGKTKKDGFIINNGAMIWASVTDVLQNVPEHISGNWWRIKDLFKQFYKHKESAECFKHGGHCISAGRTEGEISLTMHKRLNLHICEVVIPEIQRVCKFTDSDNPEGEIREWVEQHKALILAS